MSLVCISSKDDNFQVNKEYTIDNGYIYTEFDISINTREYSSEEDAIEDLRIKGYEFKKKGLNFNSGAFSNDAFGTGAIFGDLASFMSSISPEPSVDAKRAEAENMKNDILSSILKGM